MFFLTTNKIANVLKDEILVALEMDDQEEKDQKSKEILFGMNMIKCSLSRITILERNLQMLL